MNKDIDRFLITANDTVGGEMSALISGLGKVVATITLIIAALVTFTDVTLFSVDTESYAATLAIMIISSYLMYFSLFDVGEQRGRESEAYSESYKHYSATRVKISGDMIPDLRDFAERYSRAEFDSRRREKLMMLGYSDEDLLGDALDADKKRARRKINRIKPYILTPRLLLSTDRSEGRSELANPERSRVIRSFLRLLPSTVCTCLTVSVILSPKDGLSTADVINGILKLSALPIIGIRGYTAGMIFSERTRSSWLSTRSRILEAFLAEKSLK